MTATALTAPVVWAPMIPAAGFAGTSMGSDGTMVLNGAGDKLWFVFQAASATCPDGVRFRCSSYTSTGTVDVTIETLDDTTGFPSGTPVTNSNTASVSVTSTGVKSVTGLAGTATLTKATSYAIVLTATSGFAGNFQLLRTNGGNNNSRLAYSGTKDSAGAHTKAATTNPGFPIGLFDAGGAGIKVPGLIGPSSTTLVAYDSTTNPFERGNRMTFPVPVTICGAYIICVNGSSPANGNSMEIDLYTEHTSGSPTLRASQAFDGDDLGAAWGQLLLFNAPYDMAANTTFALIAKATSTSGLSLMTFDYAATAEVGCLHDANCYSTTRNGGTGAFADGNTRVYAIFPVFSKLDDGAGGGGLALPVSGRICA